jgi:rhodanese-related sulfurtransferase
MNMEFLQNNIFWAVLAVVSGVLYLWNLARSEGMSPQEAVNLVNRDSGVVLDVREKIPYGESHIVGARNIPVAQFEARLGELEKFKSKPIVVYGDGTGASRAIKLLKKQGFEKVAGLDGGLKAWADAGLPTES